MGKSRGGQVETKAAAYKKAVSLRWEWRLREIKAGGRKLELLRGGEAEAAVKLKLESEVRNLERQFGYAMNARRPGVEFAFSAGGSYRDVQNFDKDAKEQSGVRLEANHSPPWQFYKDAKLVSDVPNGGSGSCSKRLTKTSAPCHSMMYYHHRNRRKGLGGATSTGGSGARAGWVKHLVQLHKRHGFVAAMEEDFKDILNTTAPNRGFYVRALAECATYAVSLGLVKERECGRLMNALFGSVSLRPATVVAAKDVAGDISILR